jgi:hypothetical protein
MEPTMSYRTKNLDRWYACPGCASPERAPLHGGRVECSRCCTVHALPDRAALPTNGAALQLPPNDPARTRHLRAQDGRPRQVPLTLQAVLGGTSVQLGREQEALAVWLSLRARSQGGDVAASEDLTTLTLLLDQVPARPPELREALIESACDAAVLLRHRQGMLGRLVRLAVGRGDRSHAVRTLACMEPWSPVLELDSELRVSLAALATLDGDGRRVLALLGPQKGAVPIVDAMAPLASVLRANAYETLGDVTSAAQVLRELPATWMLPVVEGNFPALRLCAQSGPAYGAAATQEAAERAAASADWGTPIGGIFVVTGLVAIVIGLIVRSPFAVFVPGVPMLVAGVVHVARGRAAAKRARWLRAYGLSLAARIVSARPTGTQINSVPVLRFSLQVAGPQGPYAANFDKLLPEHQVAQLIGGEVRVRANPGNLQEVIPED